MFLLNTAYDSWQVRQSLAPSSADPGGIWKACKSDISHCNSSQIQFLQDFRNQMAIALNSFSESAQNGLFINSCFAHCQSEIQDTWFAQDSPKLDGKEQVQIRTLCAHDSCPPAIYFVVQLMYVSSILQVPELVSSFQWRLCKFMEKSLVENVFPILLVTFNCKLTQLLDQCIERVTRSDCSFQQKLK